MAEENDLEKRAVEELLKETDRARVRAETMGPTGCCNMCRTVQKLCPHCRRLKCPLQSTNKRFLLNTLRSTGVQSIDEPSDGHAAARGRPRRDSPERGRERSRTPPRYHSSSEGRSDHKRHHRDKEKRPDKGGERSYRHADHREQRHGRDGGGGGGDKDRPHE